MQADNSCTFYCTFKSEIGVYKQEMTIKTDHSIWKNVCGVIETEMLGRSRDSDFELLQSLQQPNRHLIDSSYAQEKLKFSRPHRSMIKAKVIGNAKSSTLIDVERKELLRRCKLLPFLENNSLLYDGDILVLWRLPIYYDDMLQIYKRKKQLCEKTWTSEYRHLLRLPDKNTFYHRTEEAPVLFGQHQWLAESTVSSDLKPTELQFDESMNEAERMASIVEHAGTSHAISAEEQQKYLQQKHLGFNHHHHHHQNSDSSNAQYKTRLPPQNYVCVRCKVPGHWLKYCPTRNDARYDMRTILSTNGVSKHILQRIEMDEITLDYTGNVYRDQLGHYYIRKTDVEDKLGQIWSAQFDFAMAQI